MRIILLPQAMASAKDKTLLPNRFKVTESHLKENGGADQVWMSEFKNVGKTTNNDPMKLDTITMGTIDTECCSYATETSGVQISIVSSWSKSAANQKKYSTTMLIDCIILEPSKE